LRARALELAERAVAAAPRFWNYARHVRKTRAQRRNGLCQPLRFRRRDYADVLEHTERALDLAAFYVVRAGDLTAPRAEAGLCAVLLAQLDHRVERGERAGESGVIAPRLLACGLVARDRLPYGHVADLCALERGERRVELVLCCDLCRRLRLLDRLEGDRIDRAGVDACLDRRRLLTLQLLHRVVRPDASARRRRVLLLLLTKNLAEHFARADVHVVLFALGVESYALPRFLDQPSLLDWVLRILGRLRVSDALLALLLKLQFLAACLQVARVLLGLHVGLPAFERVVFARQLRVVLINLLVALVCARVGLHDCAAVLTRKRTRDLAAVFAAAQQRRKDAAKHRHVGTAELMPLHVIEIGRGRCSRWRRVPWESATSRLRHDRGRERLLLEARRRVVGRRTVADDAAEHLLELLVLVVLTVQTHYQL